MPLPSQTLAALQLAGATIYQADLELKEAVKAYENQLRTAMTANPFEMRNDGLFEEWKAVARMSQAVAQIEVEFKKIYEMASGLTGAAALPNPTMSTLVAPPSAGATDLKLVKDIQASDAVVKGPRASQTKKSPGGNAPKPLTGNTAKLFAHLIEVMKANAFVKIDRHAVIIEAGIPRGSVGAAIAKLLETGHLVANASGAHKLSTPRSAKK